jgi:hypothetical protein
VEGVQTAARQSGTLAKNVSVATSDDNGFFFYYGIQSNPDACDYAAANASYNFEFYKGVLAIRPCLSAMDGRLRFIQVTWY